MTCQEVLEKKYQERPSPPFHAKSCRGQTKKGNDGKSYPSKADASGIYKWVPVSQTRKIKGKGKEKEKGKTYAIHDNGSESFFVTVEGKTISVEMNMDTYERVNGKFVDIKMPRKHLFDRKVDEIFIGKKSPTGGYDGLKPSEAEGNSILVRQGSKYIYIGSEIYEFSPVKGDSIEKYYSDIGNSDVPYPYAVGKTHIYIMLDKVAVEKSFFDMKEDIYKQYYDGTTFLPMYLKARVYKGLHKDRQEAKDRIAELEDKTTKLKTKLLQKRR